MLDDMVDYLEHIRERPVWQPIPDEVRDRFRAAIPTKPTELTDVHREFMEAILPYSVGNPHPGFMAYVHGGGTPVGMLAEMLAGGLNANLGGRDHAPIDGRGRDDPRRGGARHAIGEAGERPAEAARRGSGG